jgi:hypothetical protein
MKPTASPNCQFENVYNPRVSDMSVDKPDDGEGTHVMEGARFGIKSFESCEARSGCVEFISIRWESDSDDSLKYGSSLQ